VTHLRRFFRFGTRISRGGGSPGFGVYGIGPLTIGRAGSGLGSGWGLGLSGLVSTPRA
jgi:hypothetical protein